ncbi:Rv3235 family protein [Streptomyces sp. NPDC003362]
MNKVMTRAQHHPADRPGTRPPNRRDSRRDTRRPGANPPRAWRPAPADTGAPALRTAGPLTPPPGIRPQTPRTAPPGSLPPAPHAHPADGLRTAAPHTPHAPLRVPPQTPRRPVPQPRPTDLFAERLLLVLSGRRPVHSMLGYTLGHAYDDLTRLAETGPLRCPGPRPVLRDIGYYEPRPGAFEAFARIRTGDRLRAMAFRLELGRDRRWRCTAVELDGPRRPRADDD